MNSPIVTLIIPVYNCAAYLPECLDSVCNQTLHSFEAILVDDGSTDSGPEICRQYAARDSRLIYTRQENHGVSAARNAALALAKGEFVAFLDADDRLEPEHLEHLLHAIKSSRADCVVCGYQIDYLRQTHTRPCPANSRLSGLQAIAAMLRPDLFQGFLWNKLFRTCLIRQHNLHLAEDLTHYEDLLFCAQYFSHCNLVYTVSATGYRYRQRADSAIGYRRCDAKWFHGRQSVQLALDRALPLCADRESRSLCLARLYTETADTLRRLLIDSPSCEDIPNLIQRVRSGLTTVLTAPLRGKYKLKYLFTAIAPRKSARLWWRRESAFERAAGLFGPAPTP